MLLTTGCFGPGLVARTPLVMPDGEKATIIGHNQIVPDWMLADTDRALNYVVKGDVSEKQLAAVAAVEDACRMYVDDVHPSNLVAVGTSAVLYALSGFLGVGAGSQALPGSTSFLLYGGYGAAATGLAGVANGVITLGGKTYTFQNCGREVLDLFPQYKIRVLQKSPW